MEKLAEAKEKALYFLGFRPRSTAEMRQYLQSKGYSSAITDTVVAWLQELGYIDDVRFATEWIEGRLRTKPMGRRRLLQELHQKGLDPELIETVLEQFAADIDELTLARKLAKERIRHYWGEETQAARRKLAGFLQRRGFTLDVISTAVNEILEEVQMTEDSPDKEP